MTVKENVHSANSYTSRSFLTLPDQKKTPKQTLHWFCHQCVSSRLDTEVESCGGQLVYATDQPCPFFPYRIGKRPPMKAFRRFCLECMGGSSHLVKECVKEACPMHQYRFGKNPSIKGATRERMNVIRSPGTLFPTVKCV